MDEHLQRQICKRIQQARETAGLTQEDMAGLLNVTPRAYQNYESSRVPWRRMTLIADLLGVEEKWLLHGSPESVPTDDLRESLAAVVSLLTEIAELVRLNSERLDRIAQASGAPAPGQREAHPPAAK